jgi:RNA polymerase sigma factor (sigma-70 family)
MEWRRNKLDADFLIEQMKLYNNSIEEIGFSDSVLHCLRGHEYKTIGKLARMSAHNILKIPGIGEDEFNEIVERLGVMGIRIDAQPGNPGKYDQPSKFPYPNNLIAAIKGIDPAQLKDESYTNDQLTGIYAALNSLTDQETTMIILRYKHGATLEQIGNFYGVTRERIRQMMNETLRKLRHPSRWRLIDKGFINYIEEEVERRVASKTSHILYLEYSRGYQDGINAATESDAEKKKLINEYVLRTPITNLNL